MEDDYALLISRPPPFASTSHFSVRLRGLPLLTAAVALGTVALCALLFGVTGKYDELPGDGVKIPTISRLGAYTPCFYVFSAGMHLAAVLLLLLVWAVRLAHTQRLKARTGLQKLDGRGLAARRWADVAAAAGTALSMFVFLAGTVPPLEEYDGAAAPQDKAHEALATLEVAAALLYAAVTCFGVLAWGRGVFLLSDTDVFWFRWKLWCFGAMVLAVIATAIAVGIQMRWFPDTGGCAEQWCRQASIQALGEYVMFPATCLFVLSLKHDLTTVHGNITVERVFL